MSIGHSRRIQIFVLMAFVIASQACVPYFNRHVTYVRDAETPVVDGIVIGNRVSPITMSDEDFLQLQLVGHKMRHESITVHNVSIICEGVDDEVVVSDECRIVHLKYGVGWNEVIDLFPSQDWRELCSGGTSFAVPEGALKRCGETLHFRMEMTVHGPESEAEGILELPFEKKVKYIFTLAHPFGLRLPGWTSIFSGKSLGPELEGYFITR